MPDVTPRSAQSPHAGQPLPGMRGAGVSPGTGVAPVVRLVGDVPEPLPGTAHAGDAEAETASALQALEAVAADLESRGQRATGRSNGGSGTEAGEVLSAQALMARDPGLADDVRRRVSDGLAGARAIFESFGAYRDTLAAAGGYLAERVADLDDVRDRAVAEVLGLPMPGVPHSREPFVLVARDLAPADTALLDPTEVVAFVTEEGGPTSHTAILARSLGVPAVVACADAASLADGDLVLVDGASGLVRRDPTPEQIAAARTAAAERRRAVAGTRGPGATADGHPVKLLANIGKPGDVESARDHGAEGVGLYRTEFLFLDRREPPSHHEQVEAYRPVLEAFPGGRVVVRVLDAGADKPLGFLAVPESEPNPALGERGLRMLRRHPDVLATQLAALAEAAAQAPARLEVMAPMVADLRDARWFAQACADAGLSGGVGAMVEVPSAALRARDLVGEVDFLSLGTNDLAQYAFAADRQVGSLSRLQDPWQPALLDLVALAAEAAAAAGRACGVCGEAGADPVLGCVLTGLGVTSLSMGAPALPLVRAALARHTLEQCRQAAEAARAAATVEEARDAAREVLPHLADLGL